MNRRIAAAADAAGSLARGLGQLGSLATLKHQSSRHEKGKRETEIERETEKEWGKQIRKHVNKYL